MSALTKDCYTPEEYLAIDRAASTRSEYHAGSILSKEGASEDHNIIVVNLAVELQAKLRDRPCRTFIVDMRIRAGADMYAYPDVLVVCGERRFDDQRRDVLLNPTLIVEVLSPTTEA